MNQWCFFSSKETVNLTPSRHRLAIYQHSILTQIKLYVMNRLFILALALISLTFSACGGDDDGNSSSSSDFFSANVNGSAYNIEGDIFAYGTIFTTDNTLGIYGIEGDNSAVTRTLYLIVDDAG